MPLIDVDTLLAPVSDEAPCGPAMTHETAYFEAEQFAKGEPERQMGDSVKAAVPPDWHGVADRCGSLLRETKDLRLIYLLTVASLRIEGLTGLRDGLALMRGALENWWDHLHPMPDPDDPDDPYERHGILRGLAEGTVGHEHMVHQLRFAPLTSSRVHGNRSLRDVMIAEGQLPPPAAVDGEPPPDVPDQSTINGAFEDTDLAELEATAATVDEINEHVAGIDAVMDQHGGSDPPDFGELTKTVGRISSILKEHLARRGVGEAVEESGGDGDGGGGGGQGPSMSGEVRSREDVVRALDSICRYYDRAEPSSPIPILLRRAQRLATKNFVAIVRDLTPAGLDELAKLAGEDLYEEASESE